MHRKILVVLAAVIMACGLALTGSGQERSKASTKEATSNWHLGIYTGPSPLELSQPANVHNPVLRGSDVTDFKIDTLAHPFLIVEGSRYYMFFTAKDKATDKGGIGVAESANGRDWKYRRMAIHEPFVLAYPFVFKSGNDYYMIPEAHTQTAVRLYKATKFPDEWQYQKDLLTGDHFVSPTLLEYKNTWWMFVTNEKSDTLRLFYAADFQGPWKEHPQSPVIKGDVRTARPAGRPFEYNGKLYRLAQEGYPIYGFAVRAFEITSLTPTAYAEKLIDKQLIKGTSSGWNAEAMHHIDAHAIGPNQWIAAVDALGQ